MRCRKALGIAIAAAFATLAFAGPEATRNDIATRLQQQLPSWSAAEYVQGSAAFDDALRASIEENAGAAAPVVEAGRRIFTAKFKDGRTLASCFPNGGRRVAQAYPLYDPRLKRIVTLEMAVNQCRKAHNEPLFELGEPEPMGAVTAYLRSLSNGQKMAVRVPVAAEPRLEEGRRLYFTRMGQRNFACASCHVQAVGKRFDGVPLSPVIGQAVHWPEVRDGKALTLQGRIRECLQLMGAAPFAPGSEELNRIEYFLSYLSNGLPLKAGVYRPPPK